MNNWLPYVIVSSVFLLLLCLSCLGMFLTVLNRQERTQAQWIVLLQKEQRDTKQVLDRAVSLLAAGDPLAFQQIQAMSSWASPEDSDDENFQPLTDIDEALAYAERTGMGIIDPSDLDGYEYDAAAIRSDFYDGNGEQRLPSSPISTGD